MNVSGCVEDHQIAAANGEGQPFELKRGGEALRAVGLFPQLLYSLGHLARLNAGFNGLLHRPIGRGALRTIDAIPIDMRPLYPGVPEFLFKIPRDKLMLSVIVPVMHGKHGVGVDAADNNVCVFAQNIRVRCAVLRVQHDGIGMIRDPEFFPDRCNRAVPLFGCHGRFFRVGRYFDVVKRLLTLSARSRRFHLLKRAVQVLRNRSIDPKDFDGFVLLRILKVLRQFAAPGAGFALDVQTASRPNAASTALRNSVICFRAIASNSGSCFSPKFAARLIW